MIESTLPGRPELAEGLGALRALDGMPDAVLGWTVHKARATR